MSIVQDKAAARLRRCGFGLRFLGPGERDLLLAGCVSHAQDDNPWRDLTVMILETGASLNEALRARWSSIDLPVSGWTVVRQGRAARLLLPPAGAAMLASRHAARRPGEDRVFPDFGSPSSVSREFRRLSEASGVPNLRFSDIRRQARLDRIASLAGKVSRHQIAWSFGLRSLASLRPFFPL